MILEHQKFSSSKIFQKSFAKLPEKRSASTFARA
jgi:hypothetical protein